MNHSELSSQAQTKLDALIESALGDIFPALALVVIHRGKVIVDRCDGWIDPATRRYPVTPDSRFDLASVTKTFTTTAILRHVSAGDISLDTPLAEIIPEFASIAPRPIDGGQDPHTRETLTVSAELQGKVVDPVQVTFWHLLTHTSGLAPWRDVFNRAGPVPPPPFESDPLSVQDRWKNGFEAIYAYPFVDLPGNTVHYSDLGYLLLGQALVRLDQSGDSLDRIITTNVLEPLGLTSTNYNPTKQDIRLQEIVPTEVDHLWRKRRIWGEVHDENACGLGGVAGHAGLFGTARDIATFGQAWLENSDQLGISESIWQQATSEQFATDDDRRGLGWLMIPGDFPSPQPLFSTKSFGHTGFTGTSIMMDPTRDLVVCILTNRVYPGREKPGIRDFRWNVMNTIAEGIS